MAKYLRATICTLILICLFFTPNAKAQTDSSAPLRIAVLAPLYLDSAFDNYNYKLGNTSIPKYFLPGLEFYNGVMMAIDTLQKQGANLEVWVHDTKKKGETTDSLAAEISSLNFSLIIASFTNTAEQKIISDLSVNKNIPLISATYPNDANITANPFFIMINSSLKTHIESIYKFVQRNYPAGKLIFVTRKGTLEDKIQTMFADMGKKAHPLNYKKIELQDNFTPDELLPLLDSTKQNVVICGSLDEKFGTNLLKILDQSASYYIVAVGMPTWDGLRAVSSTTNVYLEIIYSTPYNYSTSNNTIATITARYRSKLSGRPGDMVFKGYETMYYFSNLLQKYHNDMLNNLSDPSYKISNNFHFEPVKLNPDSLVPDYIENKKLYFVRMSQGILKAIN